MVGLVTCKNEEDPSRNEGTRVVTTFLPLYVYGIWQLTHKSCRISNPFMDVFVTCKIREEPIKNEGARVVTRFSPL